MTTSASGNASDTCTLLELLARAAEPAFALLIGADRAVELGRVEIGPQRVGEVKLAVGELPQKEVADALLAPGADEKIRLGRIAHGEVRREVVFRKTRGQLRPLAQHAVHGLQHVPASAVVRCDREEKTRIVGRERFGLL